ncbi:putative histone lysine methyltransferase, SET, partial [Toxoplasma gondii p89]
MGKVHTTRFTPEEEPHPSAYSRQEKQTDVERKTKGGSSRGRPPFRTGLPSGRLRSCPPVSRATRPSSQRRGISRCTEGERDLPKQRQERDGPACPNGHEKGGKLVQNLEKRKSGAPSSSPSSRHVASKMSASSSPQHKPRQSPSSCLSSSASPSRPAIPTSSLNGEGRQTRLGTLASGRAAAPAAFSPEGRASEDCLRPDSEAEEGRRSPVPCVGFLSEETSRTTSRTPRALRRTAPEGKSGETRFFSSDTHSSSSHSDALSSSVHASGQTSSQPPRTSSPSAAALRSSSISSSPSSRGSSTVRSSCASPLDFVSRKSLKSLPSPDLSEFLASRRFRGNQGEAVVTQELEEIRARRTGAERRVAEMSMQQSALGARAGELLEGDEKLRARLLALAASSPSALSQKTADVSLLNEKETDEGAALRKASPEPRLAAELYEARKREPTERGPRGMPEDTAGPEETRAAQRDGSFREEGEELRKSRRREREEKELLRVLSSSETAGGCLSAAGKGGNTREAGERRQIKGRRGTAGIFEKEKERDFAGLSSGDGSDGEDARKELDSTRRSRRKERGRRQTRASSSSSAGSPAFSLSSRVSSCGLRHVSQRKAETSQSKKERQTLGLSKDHAGALSGEERDSDEKPCFGRKRVLSVEAGSPELRSPHPGECREQLREKKRRLAAGAEREEVEERDEASRGDEQGDNGSGAKAGRRRSASLRGAADQRVTRSRLAVVEKLGVSPLEEKRHRSKKSRARFISLSSPTSKLSEEAKATPRQLRSTARDALEPRERGRLEPVARRQEQVGSGASEGEAEEQEGKPERGLLSPVSREVKARVSEALVASLRLEKGDKKEALKEKRQTHAATSPKKEEHDQDKDEQSQGKDELPEKEKEAVYLSRLRARSSCLRAPHARWVARWLQELYRWDEEVEDSDSEGVTWWHALSSAAGSSSLPETTKRDPGSRRSCRLADRAAAPPSPSRPPGGDVGALFLLALSAEGERHPGGQQVLSLLKRFSSPTLWSDAQPRVAFLDKTSGAKQLPSCLSAGDLSAQLPSVGAKAERGGRRPEAEDAEEESEEAERWKTCFSLLLAAAALPAISIKGTHRVADQHHIIRFLHITDKLVFSSSVRPGPGVAGGALSAEPEAREPQSPALLKPAGAGKATRESERDARRDGQEETERYRKREDGSRFAVKNERDTSVLSSRHRRENQLTNTHELQARLADVDWQAKLPPLPLAPNGCSCCCCFNASHSSLFASSSSSAASLPSSPSCAASSPSCAASSPSCAALSSSSSSTSASASLTSSSWTSFSSVSASSAPASASSSSSSSFASSLPLSASHAPSLERNGLPPTVQVETPALLCSSDLASSVRPECTTLASLTPDPSSVGEPSRGEPASQAQLVCCYVAAAVRAILARSYRKQMLRNARERGAFAGRKEPKRTEEGEADLSESHSLQQAGQPADGAVGDNATKETELKTHREAKGEEDEANGEARGEKGGCVASSRSSSACDSVSKASVEEGLEGGETEREAQIAEMVKQRLLSLRDLFPFLKTRAVALCTKFLEDTNAKELAGARELHGQRHTGTEAAVHQQPQTEGEETLGRRPDAVGDKGDSKMRKHKLPGPLQGVWRETLPDGKSVWMVDNELGEHGDRDAIETLSTEKPSLTASGRPLAASLLGSRASVSWDEEKHAACLSFWEEGEEGQGGDSSWTPEAGVETEDQAKGGTKDKTEEKTDGRKRYFVFASQAPASLVALLRRTARQEKEREAEAGKKKDQDGDTPAQQDSDGEEERRRAAALLGTEREIERLKAKVGEALRRPPLHPRKWIYEKWMDNRSTDKAEKLRSLHLLKWTFSVCMREQTFSDIAQEVLGVSDAGPLGECDVREGVESQQAKNKRPRVARENEDDLDLERACRYPLICTLCGKLSFPLSCRNSVEVHLLHLLKRHCRLAALWVLFLDIRAVSFSTRPLFLQVVSSLLDKRSFPGTASPAEGPQGRKGASESGGQGERKGLHAAKDASGSEKARQKKDQRGGGPAGATAAKTALLSRRLLDSLVFPPCPKHLDAAIAQVENARFHQRCVSAATSLLHLLLAKETEHYLSSCWSSVSSPPASSESLLPLSSASEKALSRLMSRLLNTVLEAKVPGSGTTAHFLRLAMCCETQASGKTGPSRFFQLLSRRDQTLLSSLVATAAQKKQLLPHPSSSPSGGEAETSALLHTVPTASNLVSAHLTSPFFDSRPPPVASDQRRGPGDPLTSASPFFSASFSSTLPLVFRAGDRRGKRPLRVHQLCNEEYELYEETPGGSSLREPDVGGSSSRLVTAELSSRGSEAAADASSSCSPLLSSSLLPSSGRHGESSETQVASLLSRFSAKAALTDNARRFLLQFLPVFASSKMLLPSVVHAALAGGCICGRREAERGGGDASWSVENEDAGGSRSVLSWSSCLSPLQRGFGQRLESCGDSAGRLQVARELQTPQTSNEGASHALASSLKTPPASSRFACSESRAVLFAEKENANWFPNDERKREDDEREKHRAEARETEADKLSREGQTTVDRGTEMSQNEEEGGNGENGGTGKTGGAIRVEGTARAARGIQEGASEQVRHQMRRGRKKLVDERCCMFPVPLRGKDDGRGAKREKSHDRALFSLSGFQGKGLPFAAHDFFETGGAFFSRELPEFRFSFASVLPPTCSLTRAASTRWRGASTSHSAAEESGASPAAKFSVSSLAPASARLLCARRDCRPQELSQASEGAQERAEEEQEARQLNSRNERKREGDGGSERAGEQQTQRRGRGRESGVEIESRTGENERDGKREMERASDGESERKREMGRERETTKRERERDDEAAEGEVEGKKRQVFSTSTRALDSHVFVRGLERESDRQAARRRVSCSRERFSWYEVFALTPLRLLPSGSRVAPTKRGTSFSSNERARLNCVQFASHDGSSSPVSSVTCPRGEEEAAKGNGLEEPTRRTSGLQCAPSLSPTVHLGSPNSPSLFSPSSLPRLALSPGVSSSGSHRAAAAPPGEGEAAPAVETSKAFSETSETAESRRTTRGGESETAVSFQRHLIVLLPSLDPQASATAFARRVAPVRGDVRSAALSQAGIEARNTVLGESETHLLTAAFAPEARLTQICHRHTPQEEANLSPGARLSAMERCSSVWSQGLLETAGAALLPASLLFVSFPLEMVRDPSPSQTPTPAAAGSLCVDVRERKAKGIWGETGTRDKGGRASEVFPAAETAGRDSQREQGTESKLAEVECAAVSLVKEENEVVSGEKRKRKTNTDVAWTFLDFVTSHSSRLSFIFREARAAAGEAGRSGTSEETGDRGKQRSGETDGHRRPGLALAVSRLRAQEGDSLCGEKGGGAEEARRANEIHAELCATKKGNIGEKEDWRSREKETSKREHNQTWSFSAAQAGTVAALGLQLWVPLFCEAAQLLWGDGQSEAEDASEGEKTNREEEQKIYGRAERNREGRTASSPLRCDCEEARGERKSEDADLEKSHCMQRSAERHSRYPPDRQEKQDFNRDRQLETRPTSEHSKCGATSSVCTSQEHNIFTSPSSPPSSGSASYAPCSSSSPSCAASFAGPVAGQGGSATECSPEGKTVSVSPRMQRAALRQLLEILDDEMHLERSEDETDEREALEDEGAERKVGGGATDGEGGEESEGGAERGENWRLSQKSQSARNKREFAVSTLSACLAFQRKETATQEGLLRQDERAAVAEHRSPSEEGEARQSEQGTQRRDSGEERQEESSFPCHDSRVQSDASLPPSGARPLPAAVAAVAELVFSRLLSVFLAFLQAQEELRAAQERAEEIQESLDQRLRPRSSLPERAAETHPSSESERRENGSCFEAQEMEKLEVDREGKRRRLSRVGTTARARARVGDPHLFLTASSGPATQGKEAEGEAGSDKREESRQATECGCSGGREPLLQAGANGLKSAEMPDSRCATSKGIREDAGELEQARKICEIARGAPQRTKQAAHATERTLEGGKDDSPEKNGDVEWAQCALSNILLSSPTVARECVAFGGFGRLPDDTRTGLHFQLTPFIARVQRGIPLLFRHQLQRSGMRQHDLVDAFASLPGLGVSPYSSSASSVSAEGPRSSAVLAPLASGLSPSLTAPGAGLEKKGDTRDGLEDERRRARRRDEKAERKAEARDEESATREKKEELDWTRVDIFAWDLMAENGLPCRDSAEDSSKEVNPREPPSPLPSSPSSRASLCSSSAAVCVPEPPPSLSRAPARMARSGGDTVGRLVSDRNESKKKRRKHKPLVVKKNSKASALCVASGASRSHGSQNGQLNPRTSSRSARSGAFSSRSLPQSRRPCVSVASLGILKTQQRPLAPQQSTPSASPSVLQGAASAGLTHGEREERKRKSPRDAKTGPSASPVLQGDATLNLGKKRDTSSPGENSRFAPPLVGSSSSRLLAAQWQAADLALLSLAAERMQERNLSAFHGLLLGEDGRLPENAELQLKRNELFFALESQSRLS